MVDRARVPANARVYAIGDVHGRFDLFEQLIAMIREDNAARAPAHVRLILLGDLIDRGPESARLVARCKALAEQNADLVVLKGNHEQAMVDALGGDYVALDFWLQFGGDATLRAWGVPEEVLAATPGDIREAGRQHVPADILAWLNSLPLTCRIGDYLFVHAGIRPSVRLARQTAADLLWIRDDFLKSDVNHELVVVHGHSVSDETPDLRHNRIGIDTGAYRTGKLSALGLENDERWTLTACGTPMPASADLPAVPVEV